MKDTRLIKLIKTFSKEELKSFEKFLQSPFLKPARDTTGLYDYIIKFYPDFEDSKLEKERTFGKLFGKEDYSEKKLQNLIFDLTKAAEDFLAYSMFIKDETDFMLNLSKGYLSKNLSDESARVNKLIEKKLKPGFSPEKDYISKFRRLAYLKSAIFTENNDWGNVIEETKKYFEAISVQFIIDYTKIVGSEKAAAQTYGKNYDSDFINSVIESFDLDKLLKLLEKSEFENKFLILLHYYILKTNQEDSDVSFYYLLRDLFYELLPQLMREEKYIVFTHLVNYCVQHNSDDKFRSECLDVYKKMIENNSFSHSENEFMQVMTYRNIVLSGIYLKDINWLEYFTEGFTKCLHPEYREDLKNLSHAYINFAKKDFDKSLTCVSKITNEFFLFKTDVRNLLLKIYYELGYTEQAFSLVDSYKHFLTNSKEITTSYKITFSNFLNYYFDLLKIKCMQGKGSPSYIKNKIEKNTEVLSKSWLIQKAEELDTKK